MRSERAAMSWKTPCGMLFFPACTHFGTSTIRKGWALLLGEANTLVHIVVHPTSMYTQT